MRTDPSPTVHITLMHFNLRWYGADDPVVLDHIRQIPGVTGVVSALHHVPVGEVWPQEDVERLRDEIASAGLRLTVVESIPVHEDVKLGRPGRDRAIDAYCRSLEHVAAAGVEVVCYNFMPVFDWVRTDLALRLDDGSITLAYDHRALDRLDFSGGTPDMPAWVGYSAEELAAYRAAYRAMDGEQLWHHLGYFLERVVPVAEAAGVRLALHPDDPPWPVFDLPRIITSGEALERVTHLVDSPANGVTLCTGSLGADPAVDLPGTARRLGRRGRLHFAHLRNVRVTGERAFHESPHPEGNVDLFEVVRALHEVGFSGPARPDHGRMIWDEEQRTNVRHGYGLYDRALGVMYLQGLWEAARRTSKQETLPGTSPRVSNHE